MREEHVLTIHVVPHFSHSFSKWCRFDSHRLIETAVWILPVVSKKVLSVLRKKERQRTFLKKTHVKWVLSLRSSTVTCDTRGRKLLYPWLPKCLVVGLGEGFHHKILVLQLFFISAKERVHLHSIPHLLYIFHHFPHLSQYSFHQSPPEL